MDVRTTPEIAASGKIEDAIEVPVDELRNNLDKLDKNLTTYVYCAKGLRGYLAFLILQQKGFKKLHNLSGGYTIWNHLN